MNQKEYVENGEKLRNNAGTNPYIYDCPWCGALKGCLCKDLKGNEYIDGSYHGARLMMDCLIKSKEEGLNLDL